jgi:hypothetical protein
MNKIQPVSKASKPAKGKLPLICLWLNLNFAYLISFRITSHTIPTSNQKKALANLTLKGSRLRLLIMETKTK